ncbi:MAG: alanine racemase [Eubacteriaceae bacterium]|nr:alanine racemase [Eubacteriaceae bacterium]
MYPLLEANLAYIGENASRMIEICKPYGVGITAVTKVFSADINIARAMVGAGISALGDSRLQNLEAIKDIKCEKWLIRMPSPSEAQRAVELADASFNTELDTLKALEAACEKAGKTHSVILMQDLGDLREGYINREDMLRAGEYIDNSAWLRLYGVGSNFACLSYAYADTEKLAGLMALGHEMGVKLISAGNSSTIDLMLSGGVPYGVSNFRLGEALLFGRERAKYDYLDGMHNDAMMLRAEIIELKDKPSMPFADIGCDSHGAKPTFADKGIRKRAILALGKVDTDIDAMWPIDPNIEIIGASGDHMALDVTDSASELRVGDTVAFRLGYNAVLRCCASSYVSRSYIQ